MRHASAIADNVNYITTSIRTDVQQVNAAIATAAQRLQQASAITEQRLAEFNALLEVVQQEAESMFVATAATVRGVRTGAAALHHEDGVDDAYGASIRRQRSTTMATTIPMRPKRGPRVRESGPGGGTGGEREAQYDLLTAALIGAAIGATATLLLRRGPSGQRPMAPVLRARSGGPRSTRWRDGRRDWARSRGGELLDRIPTDEIEESVRETVTEARDRIDGFVRSELGDLRRALRRQRKRLGV